MQVLGIDLGLRSGASVITTFSPGTLRVIQYEILDDRERPRRNRSRINDGWVHHRCQQVMGDDVRRLPSRAGIDWSPGEINMGDRRSAIWKSFLCGYLMRALEHASCTPQIITPTDVRKTLGLKARCPKEHVHHFLQFYLDSAILYPAMLESEHVKDAILLSIVSMKKARGAFSGR